MLKRDAGRVDVLEALTKLLEGVWDPELHKFPSGGGGRLWIAGNAGGTSHAVHLSFTSGQAGDDQQGMSAVVQVY